MAIDISDPMDNDPVNHPAHYCLANGAELIDIIEGLPYNRGAAIKYIFRAGVKDPSKEVEDLRKAEWMIQKELERIDAIHAREGDTNTGDGARDRHR